MNPKCIHPLKMGIAKYVIMCCITLLGNNEDCQWLRKDFYLNRLEIEGLTSQSVGSIPL